MATKKYESMRIMSLEGSVLYKNEGFSATKNGKRGGILRALPPGADHRHAARRNPRAEMAGSESENGRTSHLAAGAEGQRKGADLHTEDEILQPHDSAAARNA